MTQAEHIPEQPSAQVSDARGAQAKPRSAASVFAWLGALLAVVAWCALMWQGYVAIAVAAVGLIFSVLGMKLKRGALRNLNIAALIAEVVLLVVVLSFIFVFSVILRSL